MGVQIKYDFSDVTTINHAHRKALNLSMEDYAVMYEIAANCTSGIADCACNICMKLSLNIDRVIIIINRLKAFQLLGETPSGFVIHGRWFNTMSRQQD